MDKIKVGGKDFTLHSAPGNPANDGIIPRHPELFGGAIRTIYFWDCETRQGVPRKPQGKMTFRAGASLAVYDANGKLNIAKSRANVGDYRDILGMAGAREIAAAFRAALPVIEVTVPYKQLVEPVKDHWVRILADARWMVFEARLSPNPRAHPVWIQMLAGITFRARLLGRCKHETILKPEGWKSEREGVMPTKPKLLQELYRADDAGKDSYVERHHDEEEDEGD